MFALSSKMGSNGRRSRLRTKVLHHLFNLNCAIIYLSEVSKLFLFMKSFIISMHEAPIVTHVPVIVLGIVLKVIILKIQTDHSAKERYKDGIQIFEHKASIE